MVTSSWPLNSISFAPLKRRDVHLYSFHPLQYQAIEENHYIFRSPFALATRFLRRLLDVVAMNLMRLNITPRHSGPHWIKSAGVQSRNLGALSMEVINFVIIIYCVSVLS